MRRVKSYDPLTDKYLGMLHASEVTDRTRYDRKYKCGDEICPCTMHFRRAVDANANTEHRPETFVKNPSSEHRKGCPKNYSRIAHENVEYTNLVGDVLHVKIDFPLGSAQVDRYPDYGWLTEQQRGAVSKTRNIRPHSNLEDIIGFVEKNFESLDGEGAAEIIVNYQGSQYEWGDLFKGEHRYNDLLVRANDYSHGTGIMTEPVIVIVRPLREVGQKRGMRQFLCAGKDVFVEACHQHVTPAILCDSKDPVLAAKIKGAANNKEILALAVRPFIHGKDADLTQSGEHRISLLLHRAEQVSVVSSSYWKAITKLQPVVRRSMQLGLSLENTDQPRMAAE